DSGACGACARSSASTVISFAGIGHPFFESPQRTAEPGRARGLADAEYARGARAVELEQDAQGDDLALGRRELAQRCLELGRQPVAELLGQALVARIRLLAAAAARLGAEPVDGDAAREPAQPRARGTAAR